MVSAERLDDKAWADCESDKMLSADERLDDNAWDEDALAEGARVRKADRLDDKTSLDADADEML